MRCPDCGMEARIIEGCESVPFCINCGGSIIAGISGEYYVITSAYWSSLGFTRLIKDMKVADDVINEDKLSYEDIKNNIKWGYIKRNLDGTLTLTEMGKWSYHKNRKKFDRND